MQEHVIKGIVVYSRFLSFSDFFSEYINTHNSQRKVASIIRRTYPLYHRQKDFVPMNVVIEVVCMDKVSFFYFFYLQFRVTSFPLSVLTECESALPCSSQGQNQHDGGDRTKNQLQDLTGADVSMLTDLAASIR